MGTRLKAEAGCWPCHAMCSCAPRPHSAHDSAPHIIIDPARICRIPCIRIAACCCMTERLVEPLHAPSPGVKEAANTFGVKNVALGPLGVGDGLLEGPLAFG